ncbi:MAG: imidazolonepropionase [Anaerolineae bacterium]
MINAPRPVELLITHAAQLVTCAAPNGCKRGQAMADVGLVEDGAVAVDRGRIVAVGPTREVARQFSAGEVIEARGQVVCPGFVDAHTHLVFAGDRVDEFERRIKGATYMEIMAAGGGILSTVRATRQASPADLVQQALPRLDQMLAQGTTTAEVKTGYGLDTATELKMYQAIAALQAEHPIDLVPTFLGAHAIPPPFKDDPDGYVTLVIEDMLPALLRTMQAHPWPGPAGELLKPFFDVFCEAGVFSLEQTRRLLTAAKAHHLPLKLHADEFESLGGTALAVELGATSVDHLDVTPPDDLERLAKSDVAGVMLPAVNFNLGSTHFAPARAFVDAGGVLALATDINPGSAPCPSLPFVMALSCRYLNLTPAEALNAVTINAAYALGWQHTVGSLEAGKQADLALIDAPDYRHLAYNFGGNQVAGVIKAGRRVL